MTTEDKIEIAWHAFNNAVDLVRAIRTKADNEAREAFNEAFWRAQDLLIAAIARAKQEAENASEKVERHMTNNATAVLADEFKEGN